jgi:membrane protein implicated in regulation of membrane protease activity
MDSPEDWRWIWLIAAAVFAVGEMGSPGSFFLLPFAIGALLAAVLAFLDVSVVVEWIVFLTASIATLIALRSVAHRLNRSVHDAGVGSRRMLGQSGFVLRDIPGAGELGLVRVDREEWRAESTDGSPIPSGSMVRVADVQGTRVIVAAVDVRPPTAGGRES